MRKRLLLVGAGNFGREALAWALDVPADRRDWEIAGFLDDRPNVLDGFDTPVKIVGSPTTYKPSDDEVFFCTIGDSRARLTVCRDLESRGYRFASIIHPTAVIGPRCEIGDGTILCPYTIVTTDVRIGSHCLLNLASTVGHDSVLGDGCTLSDHCDVCGRVTLGEAVHMGSHASVIPGVTVGDGAILGAGAVAVRDVQPGSTVLGVPARART